ncbi:AAA family ATPase [Aeromonas sp. Y311-2]|uniref:AAA family ATPase n=1 Tax=Aeromonas sp. Y311-2 TaxID=2990507 RepID=UPI0022DEFA7E|nr:AAA family ATPase [Aeromonas sp. Y311-2]
MSQQTFISGTEFGLSDSIKVRCPHGNAHAMNPRVPRSKAHVFTSTFLEDVRRIMADPDGDIIVSYGGYGSGKTTGIIQFAARTLWPLYEVEGTQETSFQLDLLGRVNPATGEFVSGPLREALLHGGIFLLNEADAMQPAELVAFYELITHGVELAETGEWLEPHKLFRCVFTFNNGGITGLSGYRGTTGLSDALIDRFVPLAPSELTDDDLLTICKNKMASKAAQWAAELNTNMPAGHISSIEAQLPNMIRVMRDINNAVERSQMNDYALTNGVAMDKPLSIRSLLRWVREMLRTSPAVTRNRVKKTFHEAYAHRLVGDAATYDAAMHLCKAVFGGTWVED